VAAPTLQSFPALRTAVLFSAGVLAGQSASGWAAALFLLSLSLLGILAVHTQGFLKTPPILTTFAPSLLYFTLGCLGAAVDSGRTEQLPSSTGDSPVTLTAVVLVQPVEEGDRIRFVVESSSIVVDSARIVFRAKILVTMKSTDSSSFPSYGSIVVIQGNMFRPRSARNPGEFDQRRYYMANGIHWMLSVRSGSGLQVVGQGDGWWVMREVVLPVRKYIIREIDEAIGGQEAAYLKGILLGERGELLPEVRAAFTAAGVAHILAVSGGNVAVVVVFIYLAAELIRLPRRARPLAGCLGIVFYMLLVGFQPPVVRATIMAAIMLLGTFFEERTNPVNSLGVSALLILAH
jgi:competence protein ComEC